MMKYKTIFSFNMLILTLPAPFNNSVKTVTNYYLSPAGNNSNLSTWNQPFATTNVTTEGSTIYIKAEFITQRYM